MYTKKATDVRMRTRKKNGSGILNQNLCASNEGYANYKEGDPKASGFTFANMAYPGSLYNIGSMFREKDMGNLFQLIFTCGEYFRFKDLQLVTDSHFGHLVPIIFARFWKLFITSSFSASQRIGISGIPDLSRTNLGNGDREQMLAVFKEDLKKSEGNNFHHDSSDNDDSDYCQKTSPKKKKSFRQLKSKLHFFEKRLSIKEKGSFLVWKTETQRC